MKLLDLYCCGGGGAVGYHRSGFTSIIGIDHIRKKNYPFEFIKADILEFIRETPREWFDQFDLIHASPPCRGHSITGNLARAQGNKVEDSAHHVPIIQEFLRSLDIPYVIENVMGAPLLDPVILCGSSFGLKVRRHRQFEASFEIPSLECDHEKQGRPVGVYGSLNDEIPSGGKTAETLEQGQEAMGIEWLGWSNLKEAIPPAYTEYIGSCFFIFQLKKQKEN